MFRHKVTIKTLNSSSLVGNRHLADEDGRIENHQISLEKRAHGKSINERFWPIWEGDRRTGMENMWRA